MKTILPSYFIFSKANSLYQEPIPVHNAITDHETVIILATVIIIIALGLIGDKYEQKLAKHKIIKFLFVSAVIVLICFAVNLFDSSPKNNTSYQNAIAKHYNDHGFKLANTNLIALPAKLTAASYHDSTLTNTSKHIAQNEKVKRSQYAIYVNTNCFKLDLKKDKSAANDNLLLRNSYYLGMMDHGKFKPAHSKIGTIFANYQKYIYQNHLVKHFKKQLSFVNSNKYLTPDYQPSLVLIGDRNYTLHLSGTKKINSKLDINQIVVN